MNRRAGRRGFTLIELLLVVGLLVAIAAIALPSALDSLDRRRFEGEVDELLAQLRSAQAMARVEGAILEVRLRPDAESSARVSTMQGDPMEGAVVEVRRVDVAGPLDARDLADPEDAPPGTLVDGSWSRCRFECAVEVAGPSGSFDDEAFDGGDPALDDRDSAARGTSGLQLSARQSEETPPHGWRVALFLPDGSAPMSLPIRLRDRDGRQAVIVINAFTGRAAIERVDAAAAEAFVDPEADPIESEAGEPDSEIGAGSELASPAGGGAAPRSAPATERSR